MLENLNLIDLASIDPNGNAVLTIIDNLEWDSENEHLLVLQNKINVYLEAIESGELNDKYPSAKNKSIIIEVVSLHEPNPDGKLFLERVGNILKASGYAFECRTRPVT